jgi:hypothetical protein
MNSNPDEFIKGYQDDSRQWFFEQDDATGYLYVGTLDAIAHALHIYNRKSELRVKDGDVEVVLNDDQTRCGVLIFGKLRGVLGFNGDAYRPANVMEGDGVTDPNWTKGFEKS